mmetsp:Transcript_11801/g.27024  ORF Transcript_11801/g.27024 Transcript_11801/m.27024 type:complete len:200 (-) Transcript_11801:197-796(-)
MRLAPQLPSPLLGLASPLLGLEAGGATHPNDGPRPEGTQSAARTCHHVNHRLHLRAFWQGTGCLTSAGNTCSIRGVDSGDAGIARGGCAARGGIVARGVLPLQTLRRTTREPTLRRLDERESALRRLRATAPSPTYGAPNELAHPNVCVERWRGLPSSGILHKARVQLLRGGSQATRHHPSPEADSEATALWRRRILSM